MWSIQESATDIQKADVFFMMDTTGSMSGAIANLRTGLSGTIIPGIDAIIPDAWYGVSHFDDYPYSFYGGGSDDVFELDQRMTMDPAVAQTAVNGLVSHGGGDTPESDVPALWAVSTGLGLGTYLLPQTTCGAGEVGYPCFRNGAVPIIVLITDAPFHNGPGAYDTYSGVVPTPPTYEETVTELLGIHARVIGVHTGSDATSRTHLVQIASDTGAIDVTGNPLVYDINWDGTGLSAEVVSGIETLARDVPIDISALGRDDDTDLVDATMFIERIAPNPVGGVSDPADPTMICVGGLTIADTSAPPDGQPDEFLDVLPGTVVCFDIFPARNMTIEPTDEPQVFKAYIDVIGEGITVLDTREVFFMVPPKIEGPGIPG